MRGWPFQSKRITDDSMSSLTMILFSLFFISTTLYAQDWQKVSPDPFPGLEIAYSVFFIDENIGWVCGASGGIYKTTDAGSTWTKQTSNTGDHLYGLFFLTAANGYACGNVGTIVHTTDGGTTWTPQTSNTTEGLQDIYFFSETKGIAVGGDGTAPYLTTTDGGTTWIVNANGSFPFSAVAFADANVGVMVGFGGVLYRTTNAGSSWSLGNSGHTNLTLDVTFTSATDGYLVGSAGTIRKTTDAGVTWNAQTSGVTSDLYSVTFTDVNTGYASSGNGELLKTTDGGGVWTKYASTFYFAIYDLSFPTASVGYGVGDNALLLKTTDSGANWAQFSEGSQEECNSISFPSSLVAYCTVYGVTFGTAWKTTDGGDVWYRLPGFIIDQMQKPTSCDFVDVNTGWIAVNTNGVPSAQRGDIYKTTDGGANWTNQTSGSSFTQLSDVTFFNANYGWACGVDYQVIRTTDGGTTWASVNPVVNPAAGTEADFFGIAALDASTAIVTGYDYTGVDVVYKTTDGGANWAKQTIAAGNTCNSLAMSSPLIGVVCGGDGGIFRTTDGGDTWGITPVASAGEILYNVTFNGSVGLVVGDNGYVGVSTDAGATWVAQNSGTTAPLLGAALQGEKALISGKGIILKNVPANPMPVELVSFTAHAVSGGITLAWETAAEIDNYGFEIERATLSEGAKNFKTIGFVTGNGSSNSPKEYSFFDALVPSGTNVYRLKQIDNSGAYEYSQEIEAAGVIESFELSQNIPNPFNPETEIYYTAAVPSLIQLQVYSVTGELVETLVDKVQEAGAYTVNFGGKDLAGGVYLYTLSASPLNGAAPVTITKKMVLLK